MALDFGPTHEAKGQQEPPAFWPGYNSHYGFKPTPDAHSLFGSPAIANDILQPSLHIQPAPHSVQPVIVKRQQQQQQQQQQHSSSQSMQHVPEHHDFSLAPPDYLTPSPLSSMLSPESAQSYLPMQSEVPDIDFISQSHPASLPGHFLDTHLGSELPQPTQNSRQGSFSGSCQMLSRSAPEKPFQLQPAQQSWIPKHSAVPLAATRAPQWQPHHHPGLAWPGSGCSPDMSHVSQDLSDDTDWALESPAQGFQGPMLPHASSAEDLFSDPDIFAMDNPLLLLDDEPLGKPTGAWWGSGLDGPNPHHPLPSSSSKPRLSSEMGTSMPSILEEDVLLPAAPMDIPDVQPAQPASDLQRTTSAARPVPTHSERAPTACIPQQTGSYGSSLDSEGASPGVPNNRPAATRQNAPRRAKVQRVVTELSDVDLSDIEESDGEGEDEGEKLRQKSRPKATPRPLPGGRRKNGSHKQHNPWSAAETRSLVEGVEACGGGKWSEIKRLSLPNLAKRSTVDLKDKWRNLVRAAQLPNDQLMNRFLRKKGVPIDLIERVKVAMDMAQPPSPSAATRPTRTRPASGRLASQVSR